VTYLRGVRTGQTTPLVRSFLTSLDMQVPAPHLVRLIREHGHSEHRLHDVRAVTLGEGASPVRSGAAPQARAAVRHAVLGVRRQHRSDNSAAALRPFAWSPGAALRLLGFSLHNETTLKSPAVPLDSQRRVWYTCFSIR
jgi:hypothetical protein